MSDASLNIRIGADVKDAISGMGQTGTAATALGAKVKEADATFTVLNSTLNQSVGYMKQQRDAAQALANTESGLAISTKDVGAAQGEMVASGGKFTATLFQQRVALADVARIMTGTGFSARTLSSQLTLLPLPILATIGASVALAYGLIKLQTAQTDAEKAQQKLNQTMDESSASTQGEIAEIRDLTGIILNEANSRDLREKAFKKLQGEYPNAFKNMTLENTSLKDLTIQVDKLTDAIIRQAEIKGLEGAIADIYKEQAKVLTESTTQVLKGADGWDRLKAAIVGAGVVGLAGFKNAAIAGALQVVGDNAKTSAIQISALDDQFKKLLQTSLTKGDDQLLSSKSTKPTADKSQNETLRFLEETKKNLEEISKTDLSPVFKKFDESADGELGKLNADIVKQKIAKAISDGAKDGVSQANISRLVSSIKGLGDKQANPNLSVLISPVLDTSKFDDIGKAIIRQFAKLDKTASLHLTIGGFNQDEVAEREKELKAIAEQFGKSFQTIMQSTLGNAAESIGNAIGSGSPILKALEDVLSGGLKAIGQLYIETGVKVLLAKKTFEKFLIANPVLSIAAGVALELFAGTLKGSVNGAHAFASGGIVTGPTLGLVGEAGPEVIFPLGQIDNFVKRNTSGGGGYIPDVRLKGQDMIIAFARAQKNQGNV